MDMYFLGNLLLMFGAFALQFGLLDEDDADTGTAATGPGEPDAMNYDPSFYGSEEFGTAGNDALDHSGSPLGVAVFLNEGDDVLDGSVFDDYAEGGAGNDSMAMRPGDDIAFGGAGDDSIDGGLGDDTIFGEDGNDQITGSKGNDEVHGGAGADTLTGSGGDDMLDGGEGDDVLYGNTDAEPGLTDDGSDVLLGGEGNDALHLAGGDQGTGGAGADSFMLYDPGDSGTTAEVTDYNAAEDMIGVVYTPATDPNTGDPVVPVVSVDTSAGDTHAVVSLDGVEIARIFGGQNLTAADIALIAE